MVGMLQVAPPEIRGQMGSLNQLTICFGILGALLVNVILPPASWRIMFWIATLPALFLAFGNLPATDLCAVAQTSHLIAMPKRSTNGCQQQFH